jgi:hypothetical protein
MCVCRNQVLPVKTTSNAKTSESKEPYCWKKLVIIMINTVSYDPFDFLTHHSSRKSISLVDALVQHVPLSIVIEYWEGECQMTEGAHSFNVSAD